MPASAPFLRLDTGTRAAARMGASREFFFGHMPDIEAKLGALIRIKGAGRD